MKCLILGAGYATRLYPLTENFPKPLLKVNDKTILDWLLDDLDDTHCIDEYIIVSNHKYLNEFKKWSDNHKLNITVIDDGTVSNETRLGAVKDIELALDKLDLYDDDLLVMAGDNLLDFSLRTFIEYFKEKDTTCLLRYYEEDENKLHKMGVIKTDPEGKVISMEEKPEIPKSNWVAPPFYLFKKEDLPLIKQAVKEGCKTDAPGSLIVWMCNKTEVHAWKMPGKRYDIGNLESYKLIEETYRGITN